MYMFASFYHCIPIFAPPCIDVELQYSEILYFAQRFFLTCEVGTNSYDMIKLIASMTSSKTNSFYVKKYMISNNHEIMISIISISFAITLIANYFFLKVISGKTVVVIDYYHWYF